MREGKEMKKGRPYLWLAVALFALTLRPAFAATPNSGTLQPSTTSTASWDGFPGPAYMNDALTLSNTADSACTDGTNCDTYTLKLAPGDYTGLRVKFAVSWTLPTDDYDVYIHAGSNSGAVASKSTGSPPVTLESNVWDINGTVTAGVNDTYTVHVVYFTVGPLDAYHGVLTVEKIPTTIVRTPTYVWGKKTNLKFSK